MNTDVIISCAVTGSGDSVGKHPDIPVTPEQIASAAIEAAKAGAAIAHCHVREPDTGKPSRRVDLYEEVVQRIRASDNDVIINLTAGMGGDYMPDPDDPTKGIEGTDLVNAAERLAHVEKIKPEICSLDCGSLCFGDGLYISTPPMLRLMAKRIQELGVKPELEVFEMGHLRFANQLIAEDVLLWKTQNSIVDTVPGIISIIVLALIGGAPGPSDDVNITIDDVSLATTNAGVITVTST